MINHNHPIVDTLQTIDLSTTPTYCKHLKKALFCDLHPKPQLTVM